LLAFNQVTHQGDSRVGESTVLGGHSGQVALTKAL
jgi:hypothetical protein